MATNNTLSGYLKAAAVLVGPALGLSLLLTGCGGASATPPNVEDSNNQFQTTGSFPAGQFPNAPPTIAQILQGRYIMTSSACNECHSGQLNGPDPTNPFYLAGFVNNQTINPGLGAGLFVGASFTLSNNVVSFASNLTPDLTGIAEHSLLELFNNFRTGQHHHNVGLMCGPMPWNIYTHLTDDDTWDLVAYIKSLRPVNNLVPAAEDANGNFLGPPNCNAVPPPLNALPNYPAGNEIPVTNTAGPGLPNGQATLQQVLRGRYLVTAQLLCAFCHNHDVDNPNDPNWLAGFISDPTINPNQIGQFFLGPVIAQASNITPDPTGIGAGGTGPNGVWTAQDIFNTIRLGHSPAFNPGDEITDLYQMPFEEFRYLTDDDIFSVAAYLLSLKPVNNVVQPPFSLDQNGNVIPPAFPPFALFTAGLSPFPLPAYPAFQEINPSDPVSDQ